MSGTSAAQRVEEGRFPVRALSAVDDVETVSHIRTPIDLNVDRVLLATDGSDFSLAAIPTARALTAAFNADLHAIVAATDAASAARLRTSAPSRLNRDDGSGTLRVEVGADPAGVIADQAALASTLVCISTRARGRIGRALFGSVAEQLIDRGIPLVAVGPVADRPGWSPRSRSWPSPMSGPVVAYVDGSEHDRTVLEWAVGWAEATGKPLTVLTVVEDAPAPIRPSRRPSRFGPHRTASDYLDALTTPWNDAGVELRSVIGRDPLGPVSGIRAHLASQPGALLMVSAEPGTGLRERFARTTLRRILRASPAPSFVVPS